MLIPIQWQTATVVSHTNFIQCAESEIELLLIGLHIYNFEIGFSTQYVDVVCASVYVIV